MKTTELTPAEIEMKRAIIPTTQFQKKTLDASLRSGLRVCVSVQGGMCQVNLLAFEVRNGRCRGVADVEPLTGWLCGGEAIAFVHAYAR